MTAGTAHKGLEWRRPMAVVRWEWKKRAAPFAKKYAYFAAKWCLILGLPALYMVYRLDPSTLHKAVVGVVGMVLFFPLVFAVDPFLSRFIGIRFRLDEKGFSDGSVRGAWANVESYRLRDHEELEGVRVVELRISRTTHPINLEYDIREVDDSAVTDLLKGHLESGLLLRPSSNGYDQNTLLTTPTEDEQNAQSLLRSVSESSGQS